MMYLLIFFIIILFKVKVKTFSLSGKYRMKAITLSYITRQFHTDRFHGIYCLADNQIARHGQKHTGILCIHPDFLPHKDVYKRQDYGQKAGGDPVHHCRNIFYDMVNAKEYFRKNG